MALWTWWRGDSLPTLTPMPAVRTGVEQDVEVLVQLTSLDEAEVQARLKAGHRAYVARVDGAPAAYGWVASLTASIGELDLAFGLTPGDRYLWDFATLPVWRGRGLYPRLLQAILSAEPLEARRFWIIHAPENAASASGISKASFRPVSELSFLPDRGVGSMPHDTGERARLGAALLGVPLFEAIRDGRVLSPCWRCVLSANQDPSDEASCWPPQTELSSGCTCSAATRVTLATSAKTI